MYTPHSGDRVKTRYPNSQKVWEGKVVSVKGGGMSLVLFDGADVPCEYPNELLWRSR